MQAIGLDIGGANIKAAGPEGRTQSIPFALWRHPEQLSGKLRVICAEWSESKRVALTMTGELADCFATKSEGVSQIIAAVEDAAAGREIRIWSTRGKFVTPDEARAVPMDVAAANWHALARWIAGQFPDRSGLLIDIGSTTTDIIPFRKGRPVARGGTDLGRLQNSELVYSGVRRTPLCAVSTSVPVRGRLTPVAAELFATMLDVHLWRGALTEDRADTDTADNRPAVRSAARDRLLRMVCCDREELSVDHLDQLAEHWAAAQRLQISEAVERVLIREPDCQDLVVMSGSGEFLVREVCDNLPQISIRQRLSLSETWGAGTASAACAVAVATLGKTIWDVSESFVG